jgi:hypothetical protein
MNFEYKHLLPEAFNDNSRVWIYQCNRLFTSSEELHIEGMLSDLVTNWKTHGTPVKAYANLFFGQFIILMVDEAATGVSGCSIDSSVRVIQEIEKLFNVEMFNWQNLAFMVEDKVLIIPRQQFNYALENNFITTDTLFFNNVVDTKKELEENWLISISKSWLKTKIKNTVS